MSSAAAIAAHDVPAAVRAAIDALGERHGRPAISPTVTSACRNVGDPLPRRLRGRTEPATDFLLITPEWFMVRDAKDQVAAAWNLRGAGVRRVRESTKAGAVTGVQITGHRPQTTERETVSSSWLNDEAGSHFLDDLIARTAAGRERD